MTTLTETRVETRPSGRSGMRLFDPGGGRSLDAVVRSAWQTAESDGPAECLVCGAPALRLPEGGVECTSCRTVLE